MSVHRVEWFTPDPGGTAMYLSPGGADQEYPHQELAHGLIAEVRVRLGVQDGEPVLSSERSIATA